MGSYKEDFSIEKRKKESARILEKYPDRIPIIIEVNPSQKIDLDKKKFLCPSDISLGQLLCIIRKRIKLTDEQALFIFINETLPAMPTLLGHFYKEFKDEDGFLYAVISKENTFGVSKAY
jgi:GABA(A) receptor-associated protein